MKPIRLVCFDMWDTLCHGGGSRQIKAIKQILHADHLAYADFLKQLEIDLMTKNYPLDQGLTNLAINLHLTVDKKTIASASKLWLKFVTKAKPFPEADSMLKTLKQAGVKTTLISNTDTTSIKIKLSQLGWQRYFDKLFLSAEIGVLKPDLKIFQAVENYFQIAKNQVLYVDDSFYHGIEPARRFGWQALWLNRRAKKSGKDYINNLTLLLTLDSRVKKLHYRVY